MATAEPSPYKFLDPFEPEDHERFFGREAEIKVLLADIVTTRLVVLFAKTGTGKTSLINAGVRPLLHDRGCVTFFIRVSEDPVQSARDVIRDELAREAAARHTRTGVDPRIVASLRHDLTFAEALTTLARDLVPPDVRELAEAFEDDVVRPEPRVRLVLFFDQFEEFFLNSARAAPPIARAFVSEAARLYKDRGSGVHLVFSMREEFLAEMDIFRDEIPEIFHAESSLRLRWFTPEQAQAAISGPVGGDIDAELTTELLKDLAEIGVTDLGVSPETPIEPAQLQIVCDTIWREGGTPLSLRTYRELGGTASILEDRLVEELGKLDGKAEVDLVSRLLPELTTERGTKAVRGVTDLASVLGTEEERLMELLRELEGSGLVNIVPRGTTHFVELVHDYLAEPKRVETLRRNLGLVRPRRAVAKAAAERRLLEEAELEDVRGALDDLTLSSEHGAIVLRSAVRHGLTGFDAARVLRRAEASGASVWQILRDAVAEGDEEGAVELVAGVASPEALAILRAALDRPAVASRAVQLLGESGAAEAADILAPLLHDTDLAAAAEMALVRLSRSRVAGDAPARAAQHLESFVRSRLSARDTVELERRPVRRAPAESLAPPTERTYRAIVRELTDGSVVPFLGAGLAAYARPPGVGWQRGLFPPTGAELAEHLASAFFYPAERSRDLLRVAQYVAVTDGYYPLYRELRNIFDGDYPPTRVHRFFADLPSRFRELGRERHPLLITTSYDDALERAFAEAGEPYDVVSYVADPMEERGRLWHVPHWGEPRRITSPNRYTELSDDRTIILKLNGSVARDDVERDSFVVTEDHYIDYFARADVTQLLPPIVVARLRRSCLLFLGYSLADWNQRVFVHRIWGEQPIAYTSWAIREELDPVELPEWRNRQVEVYGVSLEHFVSELAAHVAEAIQSRGLDA